MEKTLRNAFGPIAAAMIAALLCGCAGWGEPAPDDDAAVVDDGPTGTAALALTTVSYATFAGGTGDDYFAKPAVDSGGNVYLFGQTNYNRSTGVGDLVITKMSPSGALVYRTFLGAPSRDQPEAIAVDSAGNAYVLGTTTATSAGGDIFVAKLNAAGSALAYYAYFGGSGTDAPLAIAVDGSGNAYVAGRTSSNDFPTTPGAFQTSRRGDADAFVTKINAAGNALVYSTYLGSTGFDEARDIAVDAYGYAYVTGRTFPLSGPATFPTTAGAFQTRAGGGQDAFVVELVPSGAALYYATYLGGSGNDGGNGIAVDGAFNAFVTGDTQSTNFPATPGAFQTSNSASGKSFVTKLNASGSGLHYATYLGGSGNEIGVGVAVSAAGNAYVTGRTSSTNFPTTAGAFRASSAGGVDAFIAQLNATGSALSYGTYLGGRSNEYSAGIAVDRSGNAYVAGSTMSSDFPTVSALQPTYGGGSQDAFVARIAGP